MTKALLELDGLYKAFEALVVTDSVSLRVAQSEILAIIGPNGAGKSSLVHQIAGALPPDAGCIRFAGTDITHEPEPHRCHLGMVRTFQIPRVFSASTVVDHVRLAALAHMPERWRWVSSAVGNRRRTEMAMAALDTVGLAGRASIAACDLAHGEVRALELAMALVQQPRLLILDEPMAGAGPEESARLLAVLQGLRGQLTMLLIEHDMGAVFALADRIAVLVRGQVIAEGAPQTIRDNAKVRSAYLGDAA